ncbi:MAG: SIMPL domain-containing protein [Lysobacterales bacterium]
MKTGFNFRQATLLVVTFFALVLSTASAADDDRPLPRILVTGEGSVDLAPDMAILSLTVTRQAETARVALDANSSAMKEVQAAMTSAGIEPRDLQTSGFSIQPNYFYPPQQPSGKREPPKIVGYTVRNSLTVRVRDISAVGVILDKSVSLGVNEGGNIMFTNEDPSEAITKARVKAVQHAIDKAKTLAEAAGVNSGQILEISEQSYSPRPMQMMRSEVAMGQSAAAVPVAAGENTYKVTVNVSFAIDQ